jgi:hypothetical protein
MKAGNVKMIGRPASTLAAAFAIIYSVFAVLSVIKIIPHPYELFWQFLPSLLLGFAFVVTIICLHYSIGEELKVYTAIASAFAVLYCACVTIVYFTQIAVVIPAQVHHEIDNSHILAFSDKSFMVAVDCIGYAIMSISTLFAAFAFKNDYRNKWLYRSLLYNGLLAPVIILAFFIPSFVVVGALWIFTLPAAMINAARMFRTVI